MGNWCACVCGWVCAKVGFPLVVGTDPVMCVSGWARIGAVRAFILGMAGEGVGGRGGEL